MTGIDIPKLGARVVAPRCEELAIRRKSHRIHIPAMPLVFNSFPVTASHNLMTPSVPPVAIFLLSGEKATAKLRRGTRRARSHRVRERHDKVVRSAANAPVASVLVSSLSSKLVQEPRFSQPPIAQLLDESKKLTDTNTEYQISNHASAPTGGIDGVLCRRSTQCVIHKINSPSLWIGKYTIGHVRPNGKRRACRLG